MKLLIDPLYTSKKLHSCATHYVLRKTAEAFLAASEDNFVYYCIPDDNSGFEVDEIMKDDRVINVKMPKYRDRYKEYFSLQKEFIDNFSFFGRYYDWDSIVTVRTPSVPMIRFFSTKSAWSKRHIVIFEPFPIMNFKGTVCIPHELEYQTMNGYLCADDSAINTRYELDEILKTARGYLSFNSINDLMKKMHVKYLRPTVPCGFDFPFKKKIPSRPFRALYTQRLDATERQPEKAFDSLFYTFVRRVQGSIEFDIYTNSSGDVVGEKFDPGKYCFLNISHLKREDFYKRLENGHVFISFSIEEGLPLSLFEATVYGLVGIVLRKKWSEDMFGKDYPWLVRNEQEAAIALGYIFDHYDEVYKKHLEWYRNWFLPEIVEKRGRFSDFLIEKSNSHFLKIADKVRKNREDAEDSTGRLIYDFAKKKGIAKFNVLDIMEDMRKEGLIRNNVKERMEDEDFFYDIPFGRCSSMYETVLELRGVYGAKNGKNPGDIIL